MLLFALLFFLSSSTFSQIQCNKSIISGLTISNYMSISPFFQFSRLSLSNELNFYKDQVSRSFGSWIKTLAANRLELSHSSFHQYLNSVISSDSYVEPDYRDISFTSPQTYSGPNMITLLLCTFTGISGSSAISSTVAPIRVYTCTFTNCQNAMNGGAVNGISNQFTLVNDCDFTLCSALDSGGAVYCSNTSLGVFRNSFQYCTAITEGGAFYFDSGSGIFDLRISSNLFFGCEAAIFSYYSVRFNFTGANSALVQFNKFQCNEDELNNFTSITSTTTVAPQVGYYRNAFGVIILNVHISSTPTFSPLPTSTPSNSFSFSFSFSESNPFSQSNSFSVSFSFSQSNPFSNSNSFSGSFPFTNSETFTPFPTPTPTSSPAATTIPPSASASATPSSSLTYSFSQSNSFLPPSNSFSAPPTMTPTISQTPSIQWPDLTLGLLILVGILIIAGIIANIYLIAICCKPGEILAQQIV